MKIGVLALQGAFIEHIKMLQSLDIEAAEVRTNQDLYEIDALIIPGGESTVILKLLNDFNMYDALKERITSGMPVWGTCAGMIVLSSKVLNEGRHPMQPLCAIDITSERNAFGRQVDSFSEELDFKGIDGKITAVFIRAPRITHAAENVAILATLSDGTIVAAQEGNILVTSFHPELTADNRVHQYFSKMI